MIEGVRVYEVFDFEGQSKEDGTDDVGQVPCELGDVVARLIDRRRGRPDCARQ